MKVSLYNFFSTFLSSDSRGIFESICTEKEIAVPMSLVEPLPMEGYGCECNFTPGSGPDPRWFKPNIKDPSSPTLITDTTHPIIHITLCSGSTPNRPNSTTVMHYSSLFSS